MTGTESDLCRRFIAWAQPQGWTAYAETGDWDILLVRGDGIQIGVQAKKHFNATLLRQAMPSVPWAWRESGPDYRAILLPKYCGDVAAVCDFCGLAYFHAGRFYGRSDHKEILNEFVPRIDAKLEKWLQWPAESRIKLPDYVPDVAAGASSPIRLTEWKVSALRICAVLEIRGYLTREDFKRYHVDHRRWVPMGWLRIEDGRYVRGPELMFDRQHPVNYQQILAEVRTAEAEREPAVVQKALKLKK
jgi:hypothetical protein